MKTRYYLLFLTSLIIVLDSCKIGNKYQKPNIVIPTTYIESDSDTAAVYDLGWSQFYTDTVLQELIEKALINNRDLLIAEARINEVRANKRIRFAEQFPEIGIDISKEKQYIKSPNNEKEMFPNNNASVTLNWEIDLWGKLRWMNDAAKASYLQTVENQRALKLLIIAEVAQTYFELKALDQELEIIKQTYESRKEAVHFAKLRYEGGLTSQMTYLQSEVELSRTKTFIPTLEKEIKLKENDLSLLLGEFPSGNFKRKKIIQMSITQDLPKVIPSTLLNRRPDVRAAEQRLIEANANMGVAYTSIFPSLNLAGNIGFENSVITEFIKSPTWLITGGLIGPVFNMGKNTAQYKASKAIYEQEKYSYEKTILSVFQEVNNAMISFTKAKEIRSTKQILDDRAHEYLKLAELQYFNGIAQYIDVLDAQRLFLDAEIALNTAILNEYISVIILYKALGGGITKN